jgi:hypothetical protein
MVGKDNKFTSTTLGGFWDTLSFLFEQRHNPPRVRSEGLIISGYSVGGRPHYSQDTGRCPRQC